jgi:hypothetical protein
VSVGEEESVVREFAASSLIAYPVLLDPTSRVADALDVVAPPTLMVLDRNGRWSCESGLVDEATIENVRGRARAESPNERAGQRAGPVRNQPSTVGLLQDDEENPTVWSRPRGLVVATGEASLQEITDMRWSGMPLRLR